MMMLNRSTAYFKDKDKFALQDFEKEVCSSLRLQGGFPRTIKDYNKRMDLPQWMILR